MSDLDAALAEPLSPEEIGVVKAATERMVTRASNEEELRTALGMRRLLASHEHYRERTVVMADEYNRWRDFVEGAAAEGRNVAPSASDHVAREIESWARGVLEPVRS